MEAKFKVVLIGNQGSGKTSLLERVVYNTFHMDTASTVGSSYKVLNVVLEDDSSRSRSVALGIWDTAGSERFLALTRVYYRGSEAAVILFDVTDLASWEKVPFWVNEVRDVEPNAHLVIIGNKTDLLSEGYPRAVGQSEVARYARDVGAAVYYTSAKLGDGPDRAAAAFEHIARLCAADRERALATASSSAAAPSSVNIAQSGDRETPGWRCC
jgi:small GTP-binding protein